MLYVRSNVALEEGEAVWIRCLLRDRCLKSYSKRKRSILDFYGLRKNNMPGLIGIYMDGVVREVKAMM